MSSSKVHVGLAGAVHTNMPGDDTGLYASVIDGLTALSRSMGFDLSVLREALHSEEDGRKAAAFMDDHKVDLTLFFNASLPFGRVILPLARVGSALGLWAVPEPTTSGVLQLNSFCGLNMMGSIIGSYLGQHDIPFKWFYGVPESELFQERLRVTLRAIAAIKALREARIAQIGGLANGFENMYIDERVLEKRLGTYMQTRYTVEEIVEKAKRYSEKDARSEAAVFASEAKRGKGSVSAESMEKSARVFLALRDFARENGYTALAVSCWSRFQEVYGIAVCGALSRLNQNGIVAPCEADITSAVMMIALNAMNGEKAALNDMVAFDETDDTLNLWHCGVAPACWADSSGVAWGNHFNIGHYREDSWEGSGVIADMRFRPGPVTVAAVASGFDKLFVLTGDVMEKEGYAGSSGWVGHLKVNGQPVGIREVLNTIIVKRVNHHYPTAFGDLTNELNELASWKGITVLDPVPYKPYMQGPR